MTVQAKRRILVRALEIAGDREQLARMLHVRRAQIDSWLNRSSELPDEYFLRAVDICCDHDAPSLWNQPRAVADLPSKH